MTILEYHRPHTLAEALALLARPNPPTLPLGGGTALNDPTYRSRLPAADFAVVDLQALGLNKIEAKDGRLHIGATATLQDLLNQAELWPALAEAIRLETTYNLRQMASVAGTLAACNGRSPFATALLALDAEITLVGAGDGVDKATSAPVGLGDLLPVRASRLAGQLITEIRLPLKAKLSYNSVARTPADQPIVCVAVAQWPSGRTRVALGGYGAAPTLAADGPEAEGSTIAARAAYSQAADAWASAEYRAEMAEVLTQRCLEVQ